MKEISCPMLFFYCISFIRNQKVIECSLIEMCGHSKHFCIKDFKNNYIYENLRTTKSHTLIKLLIWGYVHLTSFWAFLVTKTYIYVLHH